eukprot:scaffold83971_cov84-Attheya_sp.AAC.6
MECLHIQPNSDTTEMNQAALIYALLFSRAFLYAVNRKGPLSAHGRIWMIWSATVFFLHIKGVSTIVTKRDFFKWGHCRSAFLQWTILLIFCTTQQMMCVSIFWGHDGEGTALMLKFERGNAKSGYQDESMQDNECDNGEPAKMSSSDDSFSENIQVDLDDPGIWKAKRVKWTLAIGLVWFGPTYGQRLMR